jgi:hypothetical protein
VKGRIIGRLGYPPVLIICCFVSFSAAAQMNVNDLFESFALSCGVKGTREGNGRWFQADTSGGNWVQSSAAERRGADSAEVWLLGDHVRLVLREQHLASNTIRTMTCYQTDGSASRAIQASWSNTCPGSVVSQWKFQNGLSRKIRETFYQEPEGAPFTKTKCPACASAYQRENIIGNVRDLPFYKLLK